MNFLITKNFCQEVYRTRQNISARHIPALLGTVVFLTAAAAVYRIEERGGK